VRSREDRNRTRIEVESVAFADCGYTGTSWAFCCEHGPELTEVVLETSGRNQLEQPRVDVARVPKRVRHSARLDDQVARCCLDDLVAELETDRPLEDERVLVLARMRVHGSTEPTCRQRVFEETEAALRLVAVDHETDAECHELYSFALGRTKDGSPGKFLHLHFSFSLDMPSAESVAGRVNRLASRSVKRQYTLRKRAESQAETRQRIVESTLALHVELGPAATQLAEVARRAGVQRATVYKHFPDNAELYAACSAHWRALHPMPDPTGWETTDDPRERLRASLADIYAWYRETRRMTANVLRDSQTLPALRPIVVGGLLKNLDRLASVLAEPFSADGKRAERITFAVRAAISFDFWQCLEPLGDEEAAALGAGLVELAARSEQ
jgi:AcrR family transcriptional regulator